MDPWSLLLGMALGGAGGAAWQGWRGARRLPPGWLAIREEVEEVNEVDEGDHLEVAVEPTLGIVEWVEDALHHLYDYAYLGEHPLSVLRATSLNGGHTRLDQGRHVHELLVAAIEKLRPGGDEPEEPPRSWWPYLVLRDSYMVGDSRREIMLRLYLSEGTYNRVRKHGVRSVAKAVRDLEIRARAT